MVNNKRFSVLSSIPQEALSGMHQDTKKIIEQLRTTRGKVLACKMRNPRDAKNRMDALRRAKARGHVRYKEGHRKMNMMYFRVR